MSDTDKQYGHFEEGTESDFYIVHVSAMTGEGLHSKAEIAAELAYRDQRIAELEDENAGLLAARDLNVNLTDEVRSFFDRMLNP